MKRKKYDTLYEQNAEFLKDYFLMYKNKQDRDGGGKPTREYNRIIQAKKRLIDLYSDAMEGSLLFNELMLVGQIKHRSREQLGYYNKFKKTPLLDSLKLHFDDDPNSEDAKIPDAFRHAVYDKINSLQIEFVQEIFTENRITRLIEAVFRFNHQGYKDILTEDQIDYYARVAVTMVRMGIEQLRKYIDYQYSRLLFQDLERVEEISSIILNQKDRVLHSGF